MHWSRRSLSTRLLRQVEDLLFERGIDICHEKVRFWWNRIGRDQVEDYAARKGITPEEVETWLSANLAYDPARQAA